MYEYDEAIHENPDNGGAYVIFPWNIRDEFGKGRVKVKSPRGIRRDPVRWQHSQHGG